MSQPWIVYFPPDRPYYYNVLWHLCDSARSSFYYQEEGLPKLLYVHRIHWIKFLHTILYRDGITPVPTTKNSSKLHFEW